MSDNTPKSDEEWRKLLDADTFYITRQKGTERPFTGKYNNHKEQGVYHCACCGQELFASDAKYDSGSGWPSFFKPVVDNAVHEEKDVGHGMERIEILCNNCGAHLGHVFPDGPRPTGLRYCVNSLSLEFTKK